MSQEAVRYSGLWKAGAGRVLAISRANTLSHRSGKWGLERLSELLKDPSLMN